MLAKANNLDIEIIETVPPTKELEYLKLHPLDKVPTFVGANDWVLTEVMAISIYCTSIFLLQPQSSRMRDIITFQLSLSDNSVNDKM